MAASQTIAPAITLTGILASTDSYERLRLCLVDMQESSGKVDTSWSRLKAAIPETKSGVEYDVPYDFPLGGKADDAGIRGECWITVPGGRGPAAKDRRARILQLAKDLLGKEVVIEARPKRYSFVSTAGHNRGEEVAGTSLQLLTLEEVKN